MASSQVRNGMLVVLGLAAAAAGWFLMTATATDELTGLRGTGGVSQPPPAPIETALPEPATSGLLAVMPPSQPQEPATARWTRVLASRPARADRPVDPRIQEANARRDKIRAAQKARRKASTAARNPSTKAVMAVVADYEAASTRDEQQAAIRRLMGVESIPPDAVTQLLVRCRPEQLVWPDHRAAMAVLAISNDDRAAEYLQIASANGSSVEVRRLAAHFLSGMKVKRSPSALIQAITAASDASVRESLSKVLATTGPTPEGDAFFLKLAAQATPRDSQKIAVVGLRPDNSRHCAALIELLTAGTRAAQFGAWTRLAERMLRNETVADRQGAADALVAWVGRIPDARSRAHLVTNLVRIWDRGVRHRDALRDPMVRLKQQDHTAEVQAAFWDWKPEPAAAGTGK